MPNKTIYVSEKDKELFEQAQEIAGEALSSVIARALREFVARSTERRKGMKEITVKVGLKGSEREQRFIGKQIGKWHGLSDDKKWLQNALIFITQKNNYAVLITTVSRASLLTNKKSGKKAEPTLKMLPIQTYLSPKILKIFRQYAERSTRTVKELSEREEKAVEYLDI